MLIAATFIAASAWTINGNRNWLPLFAGFQLQPSEFAKLAIVLWIADLYARRQKYLGTPRYVITPMVPDRRRGLGCWSSFQHDLGTAVVLFAIIAGHAVGRGPAAASQMRGIRSPASFVVLLFVVATAPHRVDRFMNFLNPRPTPSSAGYQAINGMMALARGGFWGVGLGSSRQKWGALPEAHTDFILAVIGEELGLLGTPRRAGAVRPARLRRHPRSRTAPATASSRYARRRHHDLDHDRRPSSTSAWCWACCRSSASRCR